MELRSAGDKDLDPQQEVARPKMWWTILRRLWRSEGLAVLEKGFQQGMKSWGC
jgi:hypothetical protein